MIEKLFKNDLNLKRYRRFKKNKLAVISGIILLISIVLTIISPMLANSKPLILSYKGKTFFPIFISYEAKELGETDFLVVNYKELKLTETDWVLWPIINWDPYESNDKVDSYPAPPSSDNIMGTDDRGRDVFTRLLYGYKYSISYALLVWLISYIIGIFVGGTMGYFGGRFDFFGQRVIEILSTVPQFFLLLIIISIFQPTLVWLVAISSLFGWIPISYYIRGEFLKNRKQEFVEAARSVGVRKFAIIFKHILPNSLGPIITFSPFMIASGIVGLASLDYLGFGLQVPTPSWGELLNQAQKNFTTAWWLAVFPATALFSTLTFLNLLGEGVRDAMDPRVK